MQRIILHVDLDYFYAQVEELRKPELKGKAVAVCMFSGRTKDSGAVAAANYEARALGVKAGMPIAFAKKKAPQAVFLPADREYYSEISGRIMEILRGFSGKFEQVSIDEAYLDVTEQAKGNFAEAVKIAERAKAEIRAREKLSCSVGVGPNKLMAKMASSEKKPDGLTIVKPEQVKEFLRGKKISDLHGIGPKTSEALAGKGITTIAQLAATPVGKMREWFGENRGKLFHEKALGIDDSEVEERERQQFSRIETLKEDASGAKVLFAEAVKLAAELSGKAKAEKVFFKTVSIILISNKLEGVARSRTIAAPSQDEKEIVSVAEELLEGFFSANKGFVARRFGLGVSNFERPENQKKIFEF